MAGELRLTGFQAAVRGPSAADQIFEALYRQVVTLALPPGSRLSEAEVAKAAGVSRQPVRDAFFRLSQLGFLTIRPQRSTEVSVVSEQAVQQARFVRTALEVETIRLAAEGFGPDEIAQLEAILGEQAAAIDADDRERFHTLDDEFHRRICALCGHDYAWALIREQKAHMDRVRFMSLSFGAPAALADHRQILRALQANDVKRAVAAMRTHLARIEEHLPRIRAEHGEHFPAEPGRGLMDLPLNAFKRALAEGRPQIGLWCTLPGGALAELLAGAGFDWLLFDTEHSPADPITVLEQLQAAAAYPVASVVRAAWNDLVLIKRFLDVGAQSLLLPYVQDAEEARAAVAAIRYPPRGLRGVSTVSRATRFGRVPDYLRRAEAELCLLVQVETAEALARIEAIAAVDGIDGIFIGPSDLAASLGHLGAPGHPEVVAAIEDAMVRIRRAGKPAGILTLDRALARRCLELGALFVAVGLDAALLTQATDALAREFRA